MNWRIAPRFKANGLMSRLPLVSFSMEFVARSPSPSTFSLSVLDVSDTAASSSFPRTKSVLFTLELSNCVVFTISLSFTYAVRSRCDCFRPLPTSPSRRSFSAFFYYRAVAFFPSKYVMKASSLFFLASRSYDCCFFRYLFFKLMM